ncbi:Gmad2 immunoglobulin-like domain-containing protein [Micromonospora sp. NBC_01813]|uniref:Gmad2 immunoglobulin-like domain-containing protein n=1 Tax=Micromonospora sp. NBC_01813 TaxID=2975988 RepID=UPI002DDB1DBB|nr:Gmad2 immunoglobulin-like domain-containing protein [Micromonospora sp. NBC_01813]WSA10895.1 GerMN domain-containing protein [Micromonospora sp. NBC_01813]
MDNHDSQPGDDDLLRRVLRGHADRVNIRPDALTAIQEKIDARRRSRVPVALLGTAAATVAATFVGVVGCLPTPPHAPPPGAATAGPVQPDATPGDLASRSPGGLDGQLTGPGTAAPPTSGAAGEQAGDAVATLPVYYAGEVDGQLRLYREFHRFDLGSPDVVGELSAALAEMLSGSRLRDPDYRTLWPTGAAVTSVWTQYDIVGVNISGAEVANLDAAGAAAAVQQLAWTVAGVVGGDPRIRLLLDGEPVDRLWGHVDTSREIVKGAPLDTLAMLWLIEPQHGDTVGRTFTVHLAGSVFEATAQLRVRQGGQVVHQRYVTLDAGAPGRGEATVELTLAPGAYTIEAYEESMVEGEGERHLVDVAVTVR